jgi:pimeloyl-ACP methyl ester carboxylesterase
MKRSRTPWLAVSAAFVLVSVSTVGRDDGDARLGLIPEASAFTCDEVFQNKNGSDWWWNAFGNCKKPNGLTDPNAIFECAYAQIDANQKSTCVHDKLRQTAQTLRAIAAVAANNAPPPAPFTCDQVFQNKNGSDWWWNAFGNCKKPGGLTDPNAIFECAFAQIDANQKSTCVHDKLRQTAQTLRAIAEVAANNGAIANNRATVTPLDPETCHEPSPAGAPTLAHVPKGYFITPNAMMDAAAAVTGSNIYNTPAGHNLGLNEGRVRSDFSAAARAADPIGSLRWSAFHFATGNAELGRAFADLSVTGRKSFAKFSAAPPTEAEIFQAVRPSGRKAPPCRFHCTASQKCESGCPSILPPLTVTDADLTIACTKAVDRAFAVANVLRVGNMVPLADGSSDSSPQRKALGWIAVSGEDDQPHRPVNVPSTKYPQHDLTVNVHGTDVHTRYMIAQAQAPFASTTPAIGHTIPTDPAPVLAANAEVLIFVHGMDSRAEEAEDLADALRKVGAQRGKNYTIISMDLPTSGYADNIDHCQIPRPSASGKCDSLFALGDPKEPPQLFDAHGQHNAPLLDFIEDFIVGFVDALETKVPVKAKVQAVIGGSLGGNMAFRLGRRMNAPWIRSVVAWSAASVWDSKVDGVVVGPSHVSLDHLSVKKTWMSAGGDPQELTEAPGKRRDFFNVSFDKPYLDPLPGPTQAETWSSDLWPCKPSSMVAARLDRLETYDRNFRLWHWRLASEQLIFSHNGPGPNGQPLYMSNFTRMLFVCGYGDDFTGANICRATMRIAEQMTRTPGRAVFMQNTGHALDNERPTFVAKMIADFLP